MKSTNKFTMYKPEIAKYATFTAKQIEALPDKEIVVLDILRQYGPDCVLFFREEGSGDDFYGMRGEFAHNTVKMTVDDMGLIHYASLEVSRLVPNGLSVIEIANSNIPADLLDEQILTCKKYQYANGIVSIAATYLAQEATDKRESEMSKLSSRITALVEAQDDGDITPEEESELTMLRARRSALRRQTPASNAPELPSLS